MARWGSIVVKLKCTSGQGHSFHTQFRKKGGREAYGKLPRRGYISGLARLGVLAGFCYGPTLDDASVKLFSVLDLPALGLPTSPIRGSRGIASQGFVVRKARYLSSLVVAT